MANPRRAQHQYVDNRNLDHHVSKVRSASAQVRTLWKPDDKEKHDSMRGNRKREQVAADRQRDIERENMRLLQRFHEIGSNGVGTTSATTMPRSMAKGPRTLNAGSRKKELDRIQNENQHMLRRLQSVKATKALGKESLSKSHAAHQKLVAMRQQVPREPLKARAQMAGYKARLQNRLDACFPDDDLDGMDGELGAMAELDRGGPGMVPALDLRHVMQADDGFEMQHDEVTDAQAALEALQEERQRLDFQIAALGESGAR